jgi:S1-C subfamily serine protease
VAAARAETATGSGIVIGTKGEILTNAHVVETRAYQRRRRTGLPWAMPTFNCQ